MPSRSPGGRIHIQVRHLSLNIRVKTFPTTRKSRWSVLPETSSTYAVAGQALDAPPLSPGLYIVSTPIGNLRDITLRALETLAAADLVLCEDTRMSARLLDHYAIRTRRTALHEHNERAKIGEIMSLLEQDKAIALISDAGTPLLSDPGFPLVRAAREHGRDLYAIPGPSALLASLATAGLPTDRFTFAGFLPPKNAARAKAVAEFVARPETLVFYESPRRLAASVAALSDHLGAHRPAAVALELTKRFERVLTGTLSELAARLHEEPQRGEAVIIVQGAQSDLVADPGIWRQALAENLKTQSLRDAVDDISKTYSLKRKQVYDEALALQKN